MENDNIIRIRSDFKILTDESLAFLDGLGNGSVPVNEATIRALAANTANVARLGRQLADHIVRLSSIGNVVMQ